MAVHALAEVGLVLLARHPAHQLRRPRSSPGASAAPASRSGGGSDDDHGRPTAVASIDHRRAPSVRTGSGRRSRDLDLLAGLRPGVRPHRRAGPVGADQRVSPGRAGTRRCRCSPRRPLPPPGCATPSSARSSCSLGVLIVAGTIGSRRRRVAGRVFPGPSRRRAALFFRGPVRVAVHRHRLRRLRRPRRRIPLGRGASCPPCSPSRRWCCRTSSRTPKWPCARSPPPCGRRTEALGLTRAKSVGSHPPAARYPGHRERRHRGAGHLDRVRRLRCSSPPVSRNIDPTTHLLHHQIGYLTGVTYTDVSIPGKGYAVQGAAAAAVTLIILIILIILGRVISRRSRRATERMSL